MALHSIAHPLTAPASELRPRPTPGIVVAERHISMLGEVRVYLRHRRAAWKPIAFSVSVATISVSLWVVFIARLG